MKITSQTVYNQILNAMDDIAEVAEKFPWESKAHYTNWLAQSFKYVQWTTRQLALASARTKPMTEDSLHWRFLEEAKEEKKHELLALNDLKNMGFSPDQFVELPHTSFFYQTLSYLIENEHPAAILGYSLTLEGYAALRAKDVYPRIRAAHSDNSTTFIKLHCELDAEHFSNALPHLTACPEHLLPLISKSIEQCSAIYRGILQDIMHAENKSLKNSTFLKTNSTISANI